MSSGPLVEFKANDKIPGESLNLPADGGNVTLEGAVWSITPLTKVVIYNNGKIWKEIPLSGDRLSVCFREQARVSESGWFSLTVEGTPPAGCPSTYSQAVTNAVRVYVGDGKIRNRESAPYFIRWIDKMRGMADDWFGWRSQAEKDHVFSQFDEAKRVYEQRAREAL